MAKIVLGKRPDVFKPFPVNFTMPDGSEGTITPTYRYRTRAEFGEMLDEAMKASMQPPTTPTAPAAPAKRAGKKAAATKETAPTTQDFESIDFQALYAGMSEKNADHLFKAIAAWDLDVPLSLQSLKQLADELPAGAAALMAAYSSACTQGRLGN